MKRSRVLITGFGPFPGVPENPSGWLAETLAARTPPEGWELRAQVLPTEWDAVTTLTPHLYATVQPDVMIHFGVNARARTVRLEQSAHNRAACQADARGMVPSANAISPQGQHRLDTRLPVKALAAHLRTQGHAVRASRSCGRYLCNFLYYRSLEWAARQDRDALFVHVPMTRTSDGDFQTAALLSAAQETLRFVVEAQAARR